MEKLIAHEKWNKIISENGNDNIWYLVGAKNIKGRNILFFKEIEVSNLMLNKLGFKKRKTRDPDKERPVPPKPPTLRDLIQKNSVLIQKNSDAIMNLTKLMTGFFAKQDENWKAQREFNAKQEKFNAKQDKNWEDQKIFNKDQQIFNKAIAIHVNFDPTNS